MLYKGITLFLLVFFTLGTHNIVSAQSDGDKMEKVVKKKKKKKRKKRAKKVKIPEIDLTHWKVTLPIRNEKGKPYEIEPPEIFDFANNDIAKPYMYVDSVAGAVVFHAMPTSSTTQNTKYSRTELREQMEPGSNQKNWTFKDGGYMKGVIKMENCSRGDNGKYHRTIIMQIHGRLTDEQEDLIGADDKNAPPILKIYWDNGKIRIKSKLIADPNATYEELLHEDAWANDAGYNFPTEVGFGKFTLEVKVSEGKMQIVLNGQEYKTYDGPAIEKWGMFENYFKAGNYFQSRDEGAYSRVKFYSLEVSH